MPCHQEARNVVVRYMHERKQTSVTRSIKIIAVDDRGHSLVINSCVYLVHTLHFHLDFTLPLHTSTSTFHFHFLLYSAIIYLRTHPPTYSSFPRFVLTLTLLAHTCSCTSNIIFVAVPTRLSLTHTLLIYLSI